MQTTTSSTSKTKFVRRTTLKAGETRCNFRQIDRHALSLVRSKQARTVTKLMAHIYLCLVDAPFKYYESEGVLRFAGEVRDGKHLTAWDQLIELLEVADGTAHKAIKWLREEEIIGYFAGKNGAGIRIWLNRAASSIKQSAQPTQKILPVPPVANGGARVSPNATPFKEDPRKTLDTKKKIFAPKNGADDRAVDESFSDQTCAASNAPQQDTAPLRETQPQTTTNSFTTIPANIMAQIRAALEPQLRTVAAHVAAREAAREGERTKQWLDKYGLPKAARVAQREAYNIFKHKEGKVAAEQRARAELQVGRSAATYSPPQTQPRTSDESTEVAEVCLALLDLQGKPVEQTLAEISADGGWLLPSEVSSVRDAVELKLRARSVGRCSP